jgi:hypothetical protein
MPCVCCFWVVVSPLALALVAFWIWMLVDCLTRCPDADNKKLIWVLVIVLAPWVGAAIYFFVQRPKNAEESRVAAPPPPPPVPPAPPAA